MRNGLRLAEFALQARDALRTPAQLRAKQLDRDPPAVAAPVAVAPSVAAVSSPLACRAGCAAGVDRRGDFAPGASSLVTSSARSSVKSGTSGSASAGTSRLRIVPWTPLTAS
jgi:hypothetical protein